MSTLPSFVFVKAIIKSSTACKGGICPLLTCRGLFSIDVVNINLQQRKRDEPVVFAACLSAYPDIFRATCRKRRREISAMEMEI
jgi:hypothetical protein